MMTEELIALLGGREVGRVRRDKRGKISFMYDENWRERADAYPLSLSMPLAASEHGSGVIEAFLWGLLPDNQRVPRKLGTQISGLRAQRLRADCPSWGGLRRRGTVRSAGAAGRGPQRQRGQDRMAR